MSCGVAQRDETGDCKIIDSWCDDDDDDDDECDGGCIAFILICVMLPLPFLCFFLQIICRKMNKKKDEGTKVAPGSQPPTQQQTMTITIPPGAAPGSSLRVVTPSGF